VQVVSLVALTTVVLAVDFASGREADFVRSKKVENVAFGSCHNTRKIEAHDTHNIWSTIKKQNPDAFLWTGDAVYPPKRKVASVSMLQQLFEDMKNNETIGYRDLLQTNNLSSDGLIFGTWDDHVSPF